MKKSSHRETLPGRPGLQRRWKLAAALAGVILLCVSPLFGGEPRAVHELAHIGDGSGVRTIFLISNDNDDAVAVLLELFDEDGEPLALRIGETVDSSFNFIVAAGGGRGNHTGTPSQSGTLPGPVL